MVGSGSVSDFQNKGGFESGFQKSSDQYTVSKLMLDPDPVFKMRADPCPVFKTRSDPVLKNGRIRNS